MKTTHAVQEKEAYFMPYTLEMRSTASGLKVSGRFSFLFAILATVSSSFSLHDPNGISPRIIKYTKTPNAHLHYYQ